MSYILEALKKAEAERNGAMSPSIHALPGSAETKPRLSAWRNPWMWTTLAALTVIAGGAAWMFAVQQTPGNAPVVSTPAPITPRTAKASPPLALPVASVASTAPADTQPAVKEAPVQPKEKAEKKPADKPAEKKRPAAREEPKPTPSLAPAAEPPIATLRELPEQIQREIPPLAVGGYIYSGNKAERSVLINKRLLREGDEVAPGLTLEKMTQSGMVLNYKGYRYRTSY